MRRPAVVAALGVLVVALGIGTNVVEDRLTPYGPTSVSGAVGQDIQVFPFRLHVTGAEAATHVVRISTFGDATSIDTDGVWVVVELSYATVDRVRIPATGGTWLRDATGREYPVSNRSPASEWLAGADTWVGGDLAFEVAPSALDAGLELVFSPQLEIYGPMPTRYAVVPLPLGSGDVVDSIELSEAEVLAVGER